MEGQNELSRCCKKNWRSDRLKVAKFRMLDKYQLKKIIESNLYTSHLPQSSPDMILRTSGEKRMSGFFIMAKCI